MIDEIQEFAEFAPAPQTGDVKHLSDLVQQAYKIQEGLDKLEARSEHGKALLKELIEVQIPQAMQDMGVENIQAAGLKVTIVPGDFASIPSQSSIDKER